ncbi:hypothetical protein VPHK391_0043 [Vibrio phage K391]
MSGMMTIDKFYDQWTKGDEFEQREHNIKWLDSYREDWMSDDQWLLCLFLCRLFKGFHHCPTIKESNCRGNITVNTRTGYFANYDYDLLTKAVIMAHNWGVRVQISGSGPGMVKISLWKRHKREGDISEKMPTIQDMVETYKDF